MNCLNGDSFNLFGILNTHVQAPELKSDPEAGVGSLLTREWSKLH